jgi:hypothetical protein
MVALALAGCQSTESTAEPNKGDAEKAPPAPADPGPEVGPAPAPAPGPMMAEEAACAGMSAPRLDFEVDTNTGDITSIEAKASIGGALTASDVTLEFIPASGVSTSVPISVLVVGSASATVTDGAGGVQTVVATATGEPVQLDVNLPAGTTFSITSNTNMTTKADQPDATPRPTPPAPKKAVIKPVPICPR